MAEKLPWDAAAYDSVSLVQQEWGRRVLERLSLRGDETVLDAGCGTGRLTALLAEAVPRGRVLAVDLSAEMLGVARRGLAGFSQVALIEADLADLPLAGAVEVIFSNAVFHWLADHQRLFRSLFRSLKAGGRLVAQCGGAGNLAEAYATALAVAARPRFAAYFRRWRPPYYFAVPEETERRLRAARFSEIEVSLVPAPTEFPTRQAFRDFVATVILRSFLPVLPDGDRRDFVEAYVDACPRYRLDYVRLNLSGRRI